MENPKESKCKKLLLAVSMGKYRTALYRKGTLYYATRGSGLLTIIFYIIMVAFTIDVFSNILARTNFKVEQTLKRTSHLIDFNTTAFGAVTQVFDPTFFLFIKSQKNCSEHYITIEVEDRTNISTGL